MSEQIVAPKTAAKGRGKINPLAGLLNAGKIDIKDSKEFVKKLLEMTQKGEIRLDKDGAVKLKKVELKEGDIDPMALLNIKNLLSQIKLNDKLAIEKTVKELRDSVSKTENGAKGEERKDLKKLLELAKDGGVEVKKIRVEKGEDDSAQAIEGKKAEKDKKTSEMAQILTDKNEQATKSGKKQEKIHTNSEIKAKEEMAAWLEIKKEPQTLVQLLQETKKSDAKEDKKDAKKEAELKKEAPKALDMIASIFKNSEATDGKKTEFTAPTESTQVKEPQKEELSDKKRVALVSPFEAQKPTDTEIKSKMAAASEGLKNFSSDLRETIENYRPPLMKISMELNPQNLGTVDVTLISRGQNLIVNISSGQETMQMFMQNIGEFRQNLMAQGFVNLQMNFNFSEGNRDQHSRQWQKEAARRYQANNDDIGKIESLDIIMPHPKYA